MKSDFQNNRKDSVPETENLDRSLLPHTLKQKKRKAQRRLQTRIRIGILLVVILGLVLFSPWFRIRKVETTGFVNAGKTAIQEAADRQLGRHIMFYGKKEILSAAGQDAFVRDISVKAAFGGTLHVDISEYGADYALVTGDKTLILNREGRVLGSRLIVPQGVTLLLDDTKPLPPGNTMYAAGHKKTFLADFKDIMDQNTSTIDFSEIDLRDPACTWLKSGDWQVEIGMPSDQETLKIKLNQAINILKQAGWMEPGVIDLRFDAPPVIRPKGGT